MHRAGIYCGIFFGIFLAISLYANGGKTIIAEGRASLANVNAEIARERAIENALRAAVEEGTGTFLSSQSQSQNFQLISDNIIAHSSGYVSEYKILSEKQASGFYIIRVSAIVNTGNIERDLQAIGLLLERKNLPRLMVLLEEQWQSSSFGENQHIRRTQAEAMAASSFIEKGFLVIDSRILKASRDHEQALLAIKGNPRAAAVLGRLHEADVIVAGEVLSQSRGKIWGSNFVSVSTTITIKVVNSDTAEILSEKTWSSSGAGLDETAASSSAIERGMKKVCPELISDLLAQWSQDTAGLHTVQFHVDRIRSLTDLEFMESTLANQIAGIKSIHRRGFDAGTALFDAQINGEAGAIATAIQNYIFKRFRVVVVGFSANTIKLQIHYIDNN